MRGAFAWAALAVVAVAALEAASLYHFYRGQSRLPLWDMAENGWGGVELLRTLRAGSPLEFLDRLNRQDRWPFGYSLLLIPFLAAGGASFASATLLSTVLFALVPLLLLGVARETDSGPAGLWGGLLGAALFLSSPLLRVFAILVMREMAGIFFSLLGIACYLRARRLGTPWAWRLVGLTSLALFLVKYNYALVWGLTVLVHEAWRLPAPRRRELLRAAVRLFRPWRQPSRSRMTLALYLDLLILLTALGINPGATMVAGLIAVGVVLILRWRRDPAGCRARWDALPVSARAGLATFALPVWVWFLSPDPIHPQSIIAFLRNRATGPPLGSAESLGYYFRALVQAYAPEPAVGALVLLGLIVAVIRMRSAGEPFRLLALAAVLGLALAILHPYKELRFIAVPAPMVMLLAGLALSRAAHGRGPAAGLRVAIGGSLCAAALAGIGWSTHRADLASRLAQDYQLYSGRPELSRALQFLTQRAAGARRVAVLGTFNELSHHLVRWRMAQEEGARATTVAEPPSRFGSDLAPEEVRKGLGRWLVEERPERVLALRLSPASDLYGPDFQRYNAWQLAVIEALEHHPDWQITERQSFPELLLEAIVYRRVGDG